jgi:hypothetical protein
VTPVTVLTRKRAARRPPSRQPGEPSWRRRQPRHVDAVRAEPAQHRETPARPPWTLTGKRRSRPRYQVETASTRLVELCVSSNVCARFRYLLRAATSAIRAGRRCCAIGFWKSRLLHSMPSSRQSCFAFSMISATVGSDTVGPKVRRAGRTARSSIGFSRRAPTPPALQPTRRRDNR